MINYCCANKKPVFCVPNASSSQLLVNAVLLGSVSTWIKLPSKWKVNLCEK